jgi:hypothetical protein
MMVSQEKKAGRLGGLEAMRLKEMEKMFQPEA